MEAEDRGKEVPLCVGDHRLVRRGQRQIDANGPHTPSFHEQHAHVRREGVPAMAYRPGRLPKPSHYPSLRLMRGLVTAPAPTFLIGSGHLSGRTAFYFQGQHSSPASTEPSLA